jgi:FkbM family methyltransferase
MVAAAFGSKRIKPTPSQTEKMKVRKNLNQTILEKIHSGALLGMNIGRGTNLKNSGEIYVLKYIKKHLKDVTNPVIFDVGANIGGYSKVVSEIFKDMCVIHAFEPSQKTFNEAASLLKSKPNIILNNLGLSDKEQDLLLFSDMEKSGLASVYERRLDHFNLKMDRQEKIHLTTLDNYCKKNNIDHIHFLKLDIEGHELNALHGAKEMFSRGKIDFVQFEFGGCNIDSRTFFQDFFYFFNKDFNLYRILRNGLHPLPKYKETFEVFITTNFLAIKK